MIKRELLEDRLSGIKLNNAGPTTVPILYLQMTSVETIFAQSQEVQS